MIEHTTGGNMSLAELADQHNTQPSSILRLTAEHSPGGAYPANVAAISMGCSRAASLTTATCPKGCTSTCPPDPSAETARRRRGPGLPRPRTSAPFSVFGQLLGDPVVKALAL